MATRMKMIAVSVTLLATSGILFAADEAGQRCAQVRDDAERLACYDHAFGKPTAAATAATTAPVTAPAPKEQFGFTEGQVARNSGQSAAQTAPESVTAAITALDVRRDGKFVVTLDNAQVWAQSEFNSQADVEIGDRITVRRGMLGSYLLVTKAGIGTRVKRVK
jgi:hypothetical protein